MGQNKVHAAIANSDLFSSLTEAEISYIIESSAIVSYKKNETILKQGALGNSLAYFLAGYGKIYLEGVNDKNFILSITKENSIAGISSIYSNSVNNFSVASINASSVLEIPKTVLQEIIDQNKQFAQRIIQELALQTNTSYTKLNGIANKQLHGRLADTLLCLKSTIANGLLIDIGISRKEIAEMSGISTESAIRILSELNHDGIIKLDGKKIEILKENLLLKLSEIG